MTLVYPERCSTLAAEFTLTNRLLLTAGAGNHGNPLTNHRAHLSSSVDWTIGRDADKSRTAIVHRHTRLISGRGAGYRGNPWTNHSTLHLSLPGEQGKQLANHRAQLLTVSACLKLETVATHEPITQRCMFHLLWIGEAIDQSHGTIYQF